MTVLDTSAVLTFIQNASGAAAVERRLPDSVCGAANWSEVAQQVRHGGGNWALVRDVLHSYGLRVEPVTATAGDAAAALWRARTGLSLGDRLCLALGARLGQEIVTTGQAWRGLPNVTLVR